MNDKNEVCERAQASSMSLLLRKVETTAQERSLARTMQADFGPLPDDELDAVELTKVVSAATLAA